MLTPLKRVATTGTRAFSTAPFDKNYAGKTVKELRALLKEQGLPTKGLKAVLVARCESEIGDLAAAAGGGPPSSNCSISDCRSTLWSTASATIVLGEDKTTKNKVRFTSYRTFVKGESYEGESIDALYLPKAFLEEAGLNPDLAVVLTLEQATTPASPGGVR